MMLADSSESEEGAKYCAHDEDFSRFRFLGSVAGALPIGLHQIPSALSRGHDCNDLTPCDSAGRKAISSPDFPSRTTRAGTPDRLPEPSLTHSDPDQTRNLFFRASASSPIRTLSMPIASVLFKRSASDLSLGT